MPYCKKCKTSYKKDIKKCPKCGQKLEAGSNDKEELLVSVNEGYEADMVEGSLKSAGIPFVRKGHSGPAGFSRYDTKYESCGADFYVPSNLLERAKSQIPPLDGIEQTAVPLQDEPEQKTEKIKQVNPEPSRLNAKQILIIVLFFIVMAAAVFGVDSIMDFFRSKLGY